jgi:hypothetical protein
MYLNFATLSNDSLAILIFWFCPEMNLRETGWEIVEWMFLAQDRD